MASLNLQFVPSDKISLLLLNGSIVDYEKGDQKEVVSKGQKGSARGGKRNQRLIERAAEQPADLLFSPAEFRELPKRNPGGR